MALPNLSGSNIQDTFGRLLQQHTDGLFYDGLGTQVNLISASQTASMTVLSASYAISSSHEIIKEVSSSYADTASFAPNYVLNSSTSSFVTNSQTSSFVLNSETSSHAILNTDVIFSHITASGDISASGTIAATNLSGTNTGDQNLSNLAITASNVLFADITASGDISASGTVVSNLIDTAKIESAIVGSSTLELKSNDLYHNGDSFRTVGNITSSGEIKATGNIRAAKLGLGDSQPVTLISELHIKDASSVTATFEATTNGNVSIELKNNQTPDWAIKNKYSQGGLEFNANHTVMRLNDDGLVDISGSLYIHGNGQVTASNITTYVNVEHKNHVIAGAQGYDQEIFIPPNQFNTNTNSANRDVPVSYIRTQGIIESIGTYPLAATYVVPKGYRVESGVVYADAGTYTAYSSSVCSPGNSTLISGQAVNITCPGGFDFVGDVDDWTDVKGENGNYVELYWNPASSGDILYGAVMIIKQIE